MGQIAGTAIVRGDFDGALDYLHRCAGIIDRHAKGGALYNGRQVRGLHRKVRLCAFANAVDGVAEPLE